MSDKKPDPKAIERELTSYIVVVVQALIIMKCVILYFGVESANDPESNAKYYLYAAIAYSFGSLIYFAFRKR